MNREEVSIQNQTVSRLDNLTSINIEIYLDERRRRIVLCLKALKPDVEKTTISSIYHYLKAKSSNMVKSFFWKNIILILFLKNICCLGGSRAQELYNLSRFAKVAALGSIPTPFAIEANDLYVHFSFE